MLEKLKIKLEKGYVLARHIGTEEYQDLVAEKESVVITVPTEEIKTEKKDNGFITHPFLLEVEVAHEDSIYEKGDIIAMSKRMYSGFLVDAKKDTGYEVSQNYDYLLVNGEQFPKISEDFILCAIGSYKELLEYSEKYKMRLIKNK